MQIIAFCQKIQKIQPIKKGNKTRIALKVDIKDNKKYFIPFLFESIFPKVICFLLFLFYIQQCFKIRENYK